MVKCVKKRLYVLLTLRRVDRSETKRKQTERVLLSRNTIKVCPYECDNHGSSGQPTGSETWGWLNCGGCCESLCEVSTDAHANATKSYRYDD